MFGGRALENWLTTENSVGTIRYRTAGSTKFIAGAYPSPLNSQEKLHCLNPVGLRLERVDLIEVD